MKCDYCGNTSGLLDARGNCITCGAPMSIQNRNERPIPSPFAEYITVAGGSGGTGTAADDSAGINIERIAKWDGTCWNTFLERTTVKAITIGNAFLEIERK